MHKIGVLTEERYLNPVENNWYIDNIITEDNLIVSELKRLNLDCSRVAWDSSEDLSVFDFFVFRTTWNYFEKLNQFTEFLQKHRGHTTMINSYEQIIWNLDKRYLLELSMGGVNIPNSILVKKNSTVKLTDIIRQNKWKEIVIKPCVSAAAWSTYRISEDNVNGFEAVFKKLTTTNDMLVQEYQKNIESFGEVSIIMIDGNYSHAIKKLAKPGDFRVQDDFGGTIHEYRPSKKELIFAKNVISKINETPIYARVDIMVDNNGKIALSELELIEPELWFRRCPNSAKSLARAIQKKYF
ncbi:MAG: hypothetical protein CMP65_04370 [Flavobacteriales bacterium]|nr:hypothetical protein [Flavobacteriales bacterium]|tara:strand:+ start:8032 stop:8922 length:891 start_codon:yes stop_codon:yes gene_type:complete